MSPSGAERPGRVRVSAITPTYNRAPYLPQAIESVLAQDFEGVEHVIVDDGSTDATPLAVKPYLDRVRYVRQENRGQSAAWNRCVELARGEYVAFLDSDDAWLPGKLARQIPALDSDPEAGMLYAAVRYIDGEGRPVEFRVSKRETPQGWILPVLLRYNVMDTGSVIARRCRILESGGFEPTTREGNDWEMWLRIAAGHKVLYDPTPSALMRRHPEQMLADRDRMAEGLLRVMEQNARWLGQREPAFLPLAERAMARQYLRRARRCYREGRREDAMSCIRRSLELVPSNRFEALWLRLEGSLRAARVRRRSRGGRGVETDACC